MLGLEGSVGAAAVAIDANTAIILADFTIANFLT